MVFLTIEIRLTTILRIDNNQYSYCSKISPKSVHPKILVLIKKKLPFWTRQNKKTIIQDPVPGLGQLFEYTIKDITEFNIVVQDENFAYTKIFSTYILGL